LSSTRPAWRPRPTRHVTGAPVATWKKLHRHSRHYRASSIAEPVPRLEATLRMTQQCQPGTSVTGQSAAGEGPSWDSERTLSHGVKMTRPCSVPRTARARTTAAPQATRPVALTPRQGRRHLWQAKQAMLHLRHNDRVKKSAPRRSISYPFPFSSFSLLQQGPGKGIPQKGSFFAKETGPEPPN
jgi:hypothetical protein